MSLLKPKTRSITRLDDSWSSAKRPSKCPTSVTSWWAPLLCCAKRYKRKFPWSVSLKSEDLNSNNRIRKQKKMCEAYKSSIEKPWSKTRSFAPISTIRWRIRPAVTKRLRTWKKGWATYVGSALRKSANCKIIQQSRASPTTCREGQQTLLCACNSLRKRIVSSQRTCATCWRCRKDLVVSKLFSKNISECLRSESRSLSPRTSNSCSVWRMQRRSIFKRSCVTKTSWMNSMLFLHQTTS